MAWLLDPNERLWHRWEDSPRHSLASGAWPAAVISLGGPPGRQAEMGDPEYRRRERRENRQKLKTPLSNIYNSVSLSRVTTLPRTVPRTSSLITGSSKFLSFDHLRSWYPFVYTFHMKSTQMIFFQNQFIMGIFPLSLLSFLSPFVYSPEYYLGSL